MKAKRVGIYVRVSTNEQDTEGQVTELRAYVESRGWTYEVYRDKGQSGAKSVRPELTRLLGDLRKRKLDIVVVWALDRLARSLRHLLEIAEQCQSLGVTWSPSGRTSTPPYQREGSHSRFWERWPNSREKCCAIG
jgi:DNA invertase Pin-like site-specific DNA recombinase